MNRRWFVVGGVAIAAVGGVWLKTRSAAHATARGATAASGFTESTALPDGIGSSRAGQVATHGNASPAVSTFRMGTEARAKADAARARIASNQGQGLLNSTAGRAAMAASPPSAREQTMPAPVGSGNQVNQELGEYVRSVMREQFIPMGASCYEQFTPKGSKLRGRVVLDVTIVGDQSVGGVVDDVRVTPDATIDNQEFISCLRESMMAMIFRAPPSEHEKVTFTMPLDFAP